MDGNTKTNKSFAYDSNTLLTVFQFKTLDMYNDKSYAIVLWNPAPSCRNNAFSWILRAREQNRLRCACPREIRWLLLLAIFFKFFFLFFGIFFFLVKKNVDYCCMVKHWIKLLCFVKNLCTNFLNFHSRKVIIFLIKMTQICKNI